jgi:hypothetical protein
MRFISQAMAFLRSDLLGRSLCHVMRLACDLMVGSLGRDVYQALQIHRITIVSSVSVRDFICISQNYKFPIIYWDQKIKEGSKTNRVGPT